MLTKYGGNVIWFLKKKTVVRLVGMMSALEEYLSFVPKMPKFAGLEKKNLNVVVYVMHYLTNDYNKYIFCILL